MRVQTIEDILRRERILRRRNRLYLAAAIGAVLAAIAIF